jgi:putative transposase
VKRPSPKDLALASAVRLVRSKLRCARSYGYRRMRLALLAEGVVVGARRLRRVMKLCGLQAGRKRRFRTKPTVGEAPPNQLRDRGELRGVLACDTTQLRSERGPVHLAVAVELGSRCVVGYEVRPACTEELVEAALRQALSAWTFELHHSDRGTVYLSSFYRQVLAEHGLTQSCSRTGSPQDNPHLERLMNTLKHELGLKERFTDLSAARAAADSAIEEYNQRRIHSALGYTTPSEQLNRWRPSL